MRRAFIIMLSFLIIFIFIFVSANASEQCSSILKQCISKWENVKDYQCVLDAYNRKGDEEDKRVYEYKFMKPNFVYMKVLEGKSKKAKVYYNPETGKVRGCKHTFLGYICLNFDPSNPKVTSIRGAKVYESTIGFILDQVSQALSKGASCQVEQKGEFIVMHLKSSEPFVEDVNEMMVYVDKKIGLPVKWEKYSNSVLVNMLVLKDVKFNVGLTKEDFKP